MTSTFADGKYMNFQKWVTYAEKLFIVYQKFKFNESESHSVMSDSLPTLWTTQPMEFNGVGLIVCLIFYLATFFMSKLHSLM